MTQLSVARAGMQTCDKEVWEAIYDMHVALGIEGGSSDESDCEPNSKKVIAREKTWCNRWIKTIYRVVDDFAPKVMGLGRQRPGNPGRPRERREDGLPLSQDAPLRGLPETYYDEIFVNNLSPIRLKGLDVKPPKLLPIPTASPFA